MRYRYWIIKVDPALNVINHRKAIIQTNNYERAERIVSDLNACVKECGVDRGNGVRFEIVDYGK